MHARTRSRIIVDEAEEGAARQALNCSLPSAEEFLHLVPLSDERETNNLPIAVHSVGKEEKRLRNKFNYVRFVVPDLLPGIRKVVYLDVEILIKADPSLLYEKHLVASSRISYEGTKLRDQPSNS